MQTQRLDYLMQAYVECMQSLFSSLLDITSKHILIRFSTHFRHSLIFLSLQVHAKHEEKSDNRSVYREYNREFLLPKGTNPELIRSSLSRDGVLTVEAPVPAIGDSERRIPIAHK